MAHIQYDTQLAFSIPSDKRDDYFKMVDAASGWIRKYSGRYDEAIDASSDPIVIFNLDFIPMATWMYMSNKLEEMGAVNITETLANLN